jgi:lipopolysaccharide transport system ATP-binding protein
MTQPAVQFERVSKRFTIHHERARSFQDLLVRRFRGSASSEEFWALRDVSFEIEPGSALGIVGANGSGKSTLLKLVTRILTPTSGSVRVQGRVSALLELGAGFHPELTGRDNVFLNASILGLRRRDVAARFDGIVQFAGLERFIDIPVKHYSSGMAARLGFAVAINVDPDVLLIDEVLSVGDEAFQERCLEEVRRFRRAGKTLLLVSHDLESIRELCTEAVWLDGGQVAGRGSPQSTIAAYLAKVHGHSDQARAELPPTAGSAPSVGSRWGSGEIEVVGVDLLDGSGARVSSAETGAALTIRVRYHAHQRVDRPVVGIAITTADGVVVTGPNTRLSDYPISAFEGQGSVDYDIDGLPLLPGEYLITAAIYDHTCRHPYDHHERMYPLTVSSSEEVSERYGVVWFPARWSHQPQAASAEQAARPVVARGL